MFTLRNFDVPNLVDVNKETFIVIVKNDIKINPKMRQVLDLNKG